LEDFPKSTFAGAHRSSDPDTSRIDRGHLARYTSGNVDLEREVLALFAGQAVSLLNQLKAADTDDAWIFAAHSLKGCARAVGAWQVGALAEAAERRGRTAPRAVLHELIHELGVCLDATLDEVDVLYGVDDAP